MSVKHISDSDFKDFVKSGVAIVDFWAEWCGPCRVFGPVFEMVAEKFPDVNFAKFEITDANKKTPVECGVRSIPAVVAFRDGAAIGMHAGLMDDGTFGDWIKELL